MSHRLEPEVSWKLCRKRLQSAVGAEAYRHWFGRVLFNGVNGDKALFSVPTLFLKRWIDAHYSEHIVTCLVDEYPEVRAVGISVRPIGHQVQVQTTTHTEKQTANMKMLDVKNVEAPPKRLTCGRARAIQRHVAARHGVTHAEMLSRTRIASIVSARHVAIYLTRHLTPQSSSEIGRRFKIDHSTVLHAIKLVKRRMQDDVKFFKHVEELKQELAGI